MINISYSNLIHTKASQNVLGTLHIKYINEMELGMDFEVLS